MSIATELTRIQTAKANLKTQIEAKGVSVPSTVTIDTYATYVASIPQGGGGGSADAFRITNRTSTAGTISINKNGSPNSIKLKTSSDGTNWTTNEMSATTTIALPADGYVMFDGSENYAGMNSSTGNYWSITVNVDFNVSGKISSLVPDKMARGFAFYGLFRASSNNHLIDASGLILDIEYLSSYCYYQLFYGCGGLTAPPALPSIHLNNNCYQQMFYSCRALTTAPALPATELAQSCYYAMFQYCQALVTAPTLPAATLAASCYGTMFRDCTSLTSITCLAMTGASNATSDWVRSISTTGTLYVADGNSVGWAQGNAGYPSTWTIADVYPLR